MNNEKFSKRKGYGFAECFAKNSENGATDKTDNTNVDDSTDTIKEYGLINTTVKQHKISCITVIGQIEGHYILPNDNKTTKYEHIIPQLIEIEENPEIHGLLLVLNTVGGDIEAGLAIAELISGMETPVVSLVLGGGHSIGIPLAVSSDTSFIVPTATMTVHPVRTNGMVLGVPQSFTNFIKIQNRVTGFVVSNSKISEQKFTELLMNTKELPTDIGTVLDGPQAVEYGLIDRLGGISDAIKELFNLINEKYKDDEGKKDGD